MDTELLPYRLKSERRKKRLAKTHRDKQLLQLDRERDRIRNDADYATVVPLDEPYQQGWKRLFVLRPEVQASADVEFYQQILDVINRVQYHYDASFKKPKRKGHWHKYWFDELPKLQAINNRDWQQNKQKLTDEQRACFTRVAFWDEYYYRWSYYYEFTQPELFKIAILPHIIDTVKVGDALLKQRVDWIDNHLGRNDLYYRLYKLKNGNRYKGWKNGTEKSKYVNPLKSLPKFDYEDI